nr:MAG TPA: hypothetical protein [Siphoviridae sp. ctEfY6]DAX16522.1 MAG TPA: hypothetical protein [Caudoviricetes sp.]
MLVANFSIYLQCQTNAGDVRISSFILWNNCSRLS